jgi:hypothetical protein
MTVGSGGGVGSGFFTNGLTVLTGAFLNAGSCVPVDTNLGSGASPQTGCIIPGTLPCPAAQLGLTAQADGTKANATALGYGINTITTVAGAADSVLLPYAFPGSFVVVQNAVATAIQVFGKGTDTVDGVATATGIDQAASARALYFGTAGTGDGSDAGAWVSIGAAAA